MNLNIKQLIFAIGIGFITNTYAQEEKKTTEQVNDITQDDHYAMFKIGYYNPIAVGDNFANEALEQTGGVEFSFLANVFETPFLIGFQYNYFHSNVTNQELVGTYDDSEIHSFGPLLGYQLLFTETWRVTIASGVGITHYKNRASNEHFTDTATTLWVIPTVSYHFNKTLGVYFSGSYRRDFMNIHTPDGLDSFFKSANYVSFSLGLQILI
ncbi:hypothetical protein [Marixanthomonas spongiae]|uniref:Outer membrane protein beta-barrel domain-containing protein n=1 Tax=Marixanthomonas spongiae TaxID=2174845 RepID=A0A2U0I5C9_9FLAO|nr:hypothetical protein [Marixanthomonas spongiae]PVW16306.1 hypothetical protein DDV96_03310 [Marixanthomonas spongiae]